MHKLSERARAELMKANYRRAIELQEGTSPAGHLRAMLAQRRAIGDAALRAILWDSPCELMGVPSGAWQVA